MKKGKLVIYGGPMFAGKTTALHKWATKLKEGTFVLIKPSIDTRDEKDVIATHDGARLPAVTVSATRPKIDKDKLGGVKTILVDELNFFKTDKLWLAIKEWLDEGKNVVGAGLMYDFLKQPFGATLPLSKQADRFVELYARCDNCGGEANHSYRKVRKKSQVLVGAEEIYGACCEKCWVKLNSIV